MKTPIQQRLQAILDQMETAAVQSGRSPQEVTLVAVSKTVDVSLINDAIEAGVTVIGENRVQELLEKEKSLLPVEKHLIGHLQTNKAANIVDSVSLIHSLDRKSLGNKLNELGKNKRRKISALIQINIGMEESKHGIEPENLFPFIDEIAGCEFVQVEGLMCIPPICEKEEARRYFAQTYELAQKAKQYVAGSEQMSFDKLSMGMSHDFQEAILEGATFVRVGSALFGERVYT